MPIFIFGQQTYVPDDNFEAYLEANGMGNGIVNDDYVSTDSVNTVTSLAMNGLNISNLTGIEDFTSLTYLDVSSNSLTTIDITQNASLNYLYCTI